MLWTQEDLSAASGVSVRTIQRIEQGERGSLESWKAFAAGAVQGESSRDLWPFILLGAGLTGCCASILIWGWRRFIRLVPTVS